MGRVPARIALHLAFWGVSYYLLVHVFASSSAIQVADHIYTVLFIGTMAIGVYLNLYLYIPYLLNKRHYLFYGIVLAASVLGSAWFNQLFFGTLVDYLLPGYYFISYYNFADVLKFMTAFTGITTLFKLSKAYFRLQEARNHLIRLQKEKTEAELQAMRSQINPHFLFNSLNSIYSLVLKRSDLAPGAVLKLSELLRYILYETRRDKVPVETELRHMEEYVELQRLRCGPNATITVVVKGDPGNREIVPLLFLPMIENSFKHGIKGETGPVFVNFSWIIGDDSIGFTAENNNGSAEEDELEPRQGIGIVNLRKRLELHYPDKHKLEISEPGNRFIVNLTINTCDETEMPGR